LELEDYLTKAIPTLTKDQREQLLIDNFKERLPANIQMMLSCSSAKDWASIVTLVDESIRSLDEVKIEPLELNRTNWQNNNSRNNYNNGYQSYNNKPYDNVNQSRGFHNNRHYNKQNNNYSKNRFNDNKQIDQIRKRDDHRSGERTIVCFGCNGRGHKAYECPTVKREKGEKNYKKKSINRMSCNDSQQCANDEISTDDDDDNCSKACSQLSMKSVSISNITEEDKTVSPIINTSEILEQISINKINNKLFRVLGSFKTDDKGNTVKSGKLRYLVDSGSSNSFLNRKNLPANFISAIDKFIECPSMPNRFNFKIIRSQIETINDVLPTIGVRVDLVVELDDWRGLQEFIICDMVQKEEGVLGRDFLQKHKAVNDHDLDLLMLKNGPVFSNCAYQCRPLNKVTIPARSTMLVETTAEESFVVNRMVMFEPDNTDRNGIFWTRSVSEVGAEPKMLVKAINVSDHNVTISKENCLGIVHPVEQIDNNEDCYVESKTIEQSSEKRHLTISEDETWSKISELNFGSQLTKEEIDKFKEMIFKYRHVFSWCDYDIGKTNVMKHGIDTGDARPIKSHAYKQPAHLRTEIDKQIEEMLEHGIIEPSKSPWASPIILVKKKNGQYRFCIDFRKLNELTRKDAYPLPRIDEILDALGGAKIFTTLDLANGYWQIPLEEEAKCKTAFITHRGLYQFIDMPYGLTNAPPTFQRLMNLLFHGLTWYEILVYMDDVIVFATTFNIHLERFERVCLVFQKANLKIQPKKCQFGDETVSFLGYNVTSNGLQPDLKKTEAIRDMLKPTKIDELRRFLGMLSYYRRFIKQFSKIATPLYRLTESNRKFKWCDKCDEAFKRLKEALITAPVLAYPDFSKPFLIQSDASKFAIGAVLSQIIEGEEHPNAYASRHLTKCERNYTTSEKELLAVVWATKYFECYIYGKKVLIYTDHEPLTTLKSLQEPTGRLGRLFLKLQEIDYDLVYKPGDENVNADFVSRLTTTIKTIRFESEINWSFEQNKDQILRVIRDYLVKADRPPQIWLEHKDYKHFYSIWSKLSIKDETIMKAKSYGHQIVVPKHMILKVLEKHHDHIMSGHEGQQKTADRVREYFYWNDLESDCFSYCNTCETCQMYKKPNGPNKLPMHSIIPSKPWDFIGIDFTGPFKRSKRGNYYIIVAIDFFTKYCEALATIDCTTDTTARFIHEYVICRHESPNNILSDQGRNFEASVIKQLCDIHGVKKLRTTAYRPQCNGEVERQNKTLKSKISKYINPSHTDWDDLLPDVVSSYNSATHSTIRMSPFEALHGRPPNTLTNVQLGIKPNTYKSVDKYVQRIQENRTKINHKISHGIQETSKRNSRNYDKLAMKKHEYKVGDWVLMERKYCPKNLTSKFYEKYHGPFEIIKLITERTYLVRHVINTSKDYDPIHYDRLKPFMIRGSKEEYLKQRILGKPKLTLVKKHINYNHNLDILLMSFEPNQKPLSLSRYSSVNSIDGLFESTTSSNTASSTLSTESNSETTSDEEKDTVEANIAKLAPNTVEQASVEVAIANEHEADDITPALVSNVYSSHQDDVTVDKNHLSTDNPEVKSVTKKNLNRNLECGVPKPVITASGRVSKPPQSWKLKNLQEVYRKN
jgi:transposase InsO family protein